MSLTITHTIRKDKKRTDDTYTVYLRITHNRSSKYIGTDIAIEEKYWNQNKSIVRGTHDFSDQFNQKLENQLLEANHLKLKLSDEGTLTLDNMYRALRGEEIKPESFKITELAEQYRQQLQNDLRFSEWKRFGVIKNQFADFAGNKNYTVKELDSGLVEAFKKYLLHEVNNQNNTVRRKLRTFKAFTRDLKNKKVIDHIPYDGVTQPKELPTDKPKLSIEQIETIKVLDLEPNSKLWHARNYFLYSFYNAGIRFGDLCTLRWEDVQDGKLRYKMRKSKKYKSIKQFPEAIQILKLYGYPDVNKKAYIFPLLKGSSFTNDFELKRIVASRNVQINAILKQLAKLANIELNITTHIARHSFAQYALEKGLSIYVISKLLGHSSIQVTARYLKSFDEELVDQEMEKLF